MSIPIAAVGAVGLLILGLAALVGLTITATAIVALVYLIRSVWDPRSWIQRLPGLPAAAPLSEEAIVPIDFWDRVADITLLLFPPGWAVLASEAAKGRKPLKWLWRWK